MTGRGVSESHQYLTANGIDGHERFALLECLFEAAGGWAATPVLLSPNAATVWHSPARIASLARWLIDYGLIESHGPSHVRLTGLALYFVRSARAQAHSFSRSRERSQEDPMKNIRVALALSLVACGQDGGKPPNPAAGSASQSAALRLLGVRGSGPVLVRVGALELSADGHALGSPLAGKELDLGNDQNAWEVTTFDLPADAHSVAINLQFQPEGSVARSGKTQTLDLSGPPLSLVADAAQIRTRNKVVIEIDLARSLIDSGGQVFLLPDFIVRY